MEKIKLRFYDVSYCIPNSTYTVCKMRVGFNIPGIAPDFTVTGVSKVYDGDTYDETTGKRIAESKAKRKSYCKAKKILNRVISQKMRDLERFTNSKDFLENLEQQEVSHIHNLTL